MQSDFVWEKNMSGSGMGSNYTHNGFTFNYKINVTVISYSNWEMYNEITVMKMLTIAKVVKYNFFFKD